MPAIVKAGASTRSASRPYPRRSSRLSKLQVPAEESVVADRYPKTRRRKATRKESRLSEAGPSCSSEQATLKAPRVLRPLPSRRDSFGELAKRESAVAHREQECKRKAEELEERIMHLSQKESEASQLIYQMVEREAQAIMSQLEEHFTCALCYDIMAHPYTLNPGQCGHTFCAVCILKWFFSRLHRACGGWHESVDCPICRSLLVITPDRVPRLDITFPFVPNRTASAVCESLIEKLASSPAQPTVVKRESSEGLCLTSSESQLSAECTKKKGKSKDEGDLNSGGVHGWREGGLLRAEWQKKDREGKREMNYLLQNWSTLDSSDFIAMKQKLGV
ncbi:hypothetical protein BDN72DRAFT_832720 [Pluteus cervinus]|uniref:Uncharacterized protein n=1 Tax=Pluteus cervinus TaxID=181527 RepID=A0ACD3BBM7_9AGAR|nr:hypothetical protein BDN72DRAFT_832720 [Pluteus cervinus]